MEKPKLLPEVTTKKLYLHAREVRFQIQDQKYCFTAKVDSEFEKMLGLWK